MEAYIRGVGWLDCNNYSIIVSQLLCSKSLHQLRFKRRSGSTGIVREKWI